MHAVLPPPAYLISDIHLGVAPPSVERQLLEFLRHLQGRASSLLINGDLFDFWFEWRTVIPRAGFRVLAELGNLVDSGCPVVLIAGNHDCWGGDVLRKDVGLTYHVGPWEGDLGGWRTRIEHGDGLRVVEDRRYRMLRRVLRHPASIAAFRQVHPDWGARVASGSSKASRVHRARDGGAGLRNIAMEALAQATDVDLIVYGHSHVAALERAPAGGAYGNAGSWLDAPTYLRLTPDLVELREWNGSTEGDSLHALDRSAKKSLA